MITALIVATGLTLAPIPLDQQMDVSDFVTAVQRDGIRGTPSALIKDGLAVCEFYDKGYNGKQIIQLLVSSEGLRNDLALDFMLDATHYLCPDAEPK